MAGSLFVLALVVRLIPALALQNEVSDIAAYRVMGAAVLRGDNIYAPHAFFPYTPFSQFIPAWLLQLAETSHWGFDFTMKLPAILADCATTLLIFGYLVWRGLTSQRAAGWSLAWALNPVSILISAFHGNLMAAIPCLVLAGFISLELAEESPDRDLLLKVSGLLLGIAIAMRSYPALFIPAFWLLAMRTFKEALVYTALAALPSALNGVPYLIFARQTFLQELFSYSGVTDFGWASFLRLAPFLFGRPALLTFDDSFLDATKRLFLLGYGMVVLTFPFFRRRSLGSALMLGPLLFYGLYAGLSAQYLDWVLPFCIILRGRLFLPYSAIATGALVTFYSIFHPGILFGRFGSPVQLSQFVAGLNAVSNVLLVVFCLAWSAHIIYTELRTYRAEEALADSWLARLQPLGARRAYAGVQAVLGIAWLIQLGQIGLRAQETLRTVLR